MYYLFIDLFSIFFYNIDLYKNIEYIEQKLSTNNDDNSFTYYQLLKEETLLRKDINDYKMKTADLQLQYSNVIIKNRYQKNVKIVLLKDIENVNNKIKFIKDGKIFDEMNKSQVLLQYRFIFKFIYFMFFINEDFKKYINLTNYKNSIILLYSNNMILDVYNIINEYKSLLLSLYLNNLFLDNVNKQNNITHYKNSLILLYSNNMILDIYNIINEYKKILLNLYLSNLFLDNFNKQKH